MTAAGRTSRHPSLPISPADEGADTKEAAADPPRKDDAGSDKRSQRKRELVADAVITVLAEVGISGLTHRRVAKAAGISLSATTYHYATKADMLAEASRNLLAGYLTAFRRIAQDHRQGRARGTTPQAFVARLLANAVGRYRRESLAWCEIILDAARSPEGHRLAHRWFDELHDAWTDLFMALGDDYDDDAGAVQVAIDTVIGLMFIALPLRLDQSQLASLRSDTWSEVLGNISAAAAPSVEAGRALGKKAQATRAQIIEGTIRIVQQAGVGGVSYRAVASESGVALTAPAYYFGSIETLIRVAEAQLFEESKARYREMLSMANLVQPDAESLADLTAVILIREATEYRHASIAHYSVWLAATRSETLRPAVASAVLDQSIAWERRLSHLSGMRPGDGTYFQALFLGQHIRSLASGAPLSIMSQMRGEIFDRLSQRIAPL